LSVTTTSIKTRPTTTIGEHVEDPMSIFLYDLKAPQTRRQYPRQTKTRGTLERQAKEFLFKVRQNPQWAQISLMQFIAFQKERAKNGEISYSTINNYYKATKLFLEMNTDSNIINCKKISRGLPSGPKAANDRAPAIEEMKRLIAYPDRRIKPIVTP
jgi:hypothetical protein